MMMPRKKRRMLIILTIVICILAVISILVALYINTDIFKSNETLFAKYFSQNFDNISNTYNNILENEYDSLVKENKYQAKTSIKVNYAQNIGTTLESNQNPINQLKIELEEQKDNANDYDYKNIKLMKDKEKISEINYLLDNDTCAIQFPDMFNQYISAKNENINEILKETENLSDDQLSRIPDKIEFNYEFDDIFKFSKEEKQDISKRYSNILKNSIKNAKTSKQSNQTIQLGSDNVKANGYTMLLTKEEQNNIYIKLLEELKKDEIILSKFDNLQQFLNQYQIIFGEISDLKSSFVAEVQYLIDDIAQNNIGQEECKMIVYEQNGITVKNIIQGANYEIDLDMPMSGQYIKMAYKNETVEKTLICEKQGKQTNITYQNKIGEKTSKYSILINDDINQSNCKRIITAKYEDNENRVEMNMEQNVKIVSNLEDIVDLNNENSVNLNKLQLEQRKAIIDVVNKTVSEKINEIQETIISNEDIKKVLIAIGFLREGQTIVGTGVTETERNRFNSKFEILQGEELEGEAIKNLINAIKDNLVGLEPVSATSIKLKLDQFNKSEEAFTTITDFIEENGSEKYNAKVEYDETTGLVSDILLTIIQEED